MTILINITIRMKRRGKDGFRVRNEEIVFLLLCLNFEGQRFDSRKIKRKYFVRCVLQIENVDQSKSKYLIYILTTTTNDSQKVEKWTRNLDISMILE
jgi:hypothetical protein